MLESLLNNFEFLILGLFLFSKHLYFLMRLLVLAELFLQFHDLLGLFTCPKIHVIDSLSLDFELLVFSLQVRNGHSNAQLLEQELQLSHCIYLPFL